MDVLTRDARFAKTILARRPFQVLVQVTNRCNMRCSFCDFWPNPAPPREELSVADFERLCTSLIEVARTTAMFSGFCYTQFADTYQEANGLLYADRSPKVPLPRLAAIIGGGGKAAEPAALALAPARTDECEDPYLPTAEDE